MTPPIKNRTISGRLLAGAMLAMALGGAASCAHPGGEPGTRLMASGRIVDQSRPLSAFNTVEVAPGFVAEVQAGEVFAVVIRGDESFLPYVDTRVERSTLIVRMDDRVGGRPKTPLTVSVRMPHLEAVSVDGSRATITGLSARSMRLEATGSAQVRADGVKGERLKLVVDQGSKVILTGQVGQLSAQVSGSSQVEARELEAVSAKVDVAPGARLELRNVGEGGQHGRLSLR